ncbi:MAG: hypothetical protein ACK552_08395 [Microcystis sp.]
MLYTVSQYLGSTSIINRRRVNLLQSQKLPQFLFLATAKVRACFCYRHNQKTAR